MTRVDWLGLAALLASVVLTLSMWNRLPDPFPIHFDAHGVANGWAPRSIGAFCIPAIGLFTYLLVRVLAPRLVFLRAPTTKLAMVTPTTNAARPLALVAAMMAIFFALVQLAVLAHVVDALSLGHTLPILLGLLWLFLGLVFPKIRRNPFVGFRTAWSMASDENWARTHRAVSPFMVVGGIVACAGALAGGSLALPIALGAVIATALAGTVASYLVAKSP